PGEKFVERAENAWPIARTKWTKLYLNSADFSLGETSLTGEAKVIFDALGEGVTFMTPPLHTETEITGPVAAKLFVSSSTADADPTQPRGEVPRPGGGEAVLLPPARAAPSFSGADGIPDGNEGGRVRGRDPPAPAARAGLAARPAPQARYNRKSTRLNSSHSQ